MNIERIRSIFITSQPVTVTSTEDQRSLLSLADKEQQRWSKGQIGAAVAAMLIASSVMIPMGAHANDCVANAPSNITNAIADSVRVVDENGKVQPKAILNIGMAALTGGTSLAIQAGTTVAGDCVVDDMRKREAEGEIERGSADKVNNVLQVQREGAPGLFNRVRGALESSFSDNPENQNKKRNNSNPLLPDNASLNDADLLVPSGSRDQRSKFEIG